MNRLKKFVTANAELIDNMMWSELALQFEDSDLDIDQITKLTDMLQETTGLPGLTHMWCCFCVGKNLGTYVIPKTVKHMSYNLFVNTEIEYLKLSPNTTYIDEEAFYSSRIHQLELWSTNPIKVLGSRLPKNYLEYVRYRGSLITILERIDVTEFHAQFECDDGIITLDPSYYVEVQWNGNSEDVKEKFKDVLQVRMDEGLDVKCADGKTVVFEEGGGFEIV